MYILKQFISFQFVRPNKWVSESTPLRRLRFGLYIWQLNLNRSNTELLGNKKYQLNNDNVKYNVILYCKYVICGFNLNTLLEYKSTKGILLNRIFSSGNPLASLRCSASPAICSWVSARFSRVARPNSPFSRFPPSGLTPKRKFNSFEGMRLLNAA